MADLYEAHITYNYRHKELVEQECPKGWKFSSVEGDPVLGKEMYCYLTSHSDDANQLLMNMEDVVDNVGATPVRQKIEKIIYDTKNVRNEVSNERKLRRLLETIGADSLDKAVKMVRSVNNYLGELREVTGRDRFDESLNDIRELYIKHRKKTLWLF